MEERILDDEDARTIKVKRSKEGMIEDVVDALAREEENAEEETEIVLDLPEADADEYDEDLVGLTPEQLQKELERRERAAKEAAEKRDALIAEGEALLVQSDYEAAAPLFDQALLYDPDSAQAKKGLWTARTQNFTDLTVFYEEDIATDVSQSDPETKAFLRERIAQPLGEERKALLAEAEPLRAEVNEKTQERRSAFKANFNYYLIRFGIWFALTVVAIAAIVVGISFLTRTRSSWPLITAISGGVLTVAFAAVSLLYTRKLIVAGRLCTANEKLSSTEEGARLEELEEKLENLRLVLDDEAWELSEEE